MSMPLRSSPRHVHGQRPRAARGVGLGILAIALTSLPAAPLLAEPRAPRSVAEDAQYAEMIQKAIAEYQRGNFPEARAYFQAAHGRQPSARTLRGLGLCAYELRSYVEAMGLLQAALDDHDRPLTGAVRGDVERTLNEAKRFIAARPLVLEPEQAQLRVDDEPAVLRDGVLLLDPGPHLLVVEAPGHEPLSRNVVAKSGQTDELRLVLTERAKSSLALQPTAAPAETTPQQPPAPSDAVNVQSLLGLGAGIAGIVGLGIGAVFGLMAVNENQASTHNCNVNQCNPTGLEQREAAFAQANVATIAGVSGLVLLGSGLVLFLTAPDKSASNEHVRLRPALGPGAALLGVDGRF